LTGRRSLIGGHVFSHGVDYTSRAADVRRIFAGAPEADALMERYGVEYAVIEPLDTSTLSFDKRPFTVNQAFFERYPLIAELGRYRLYQILRP